MKSKHIDLAEELCKHIWGVSYKTMLDAIKYHIKTDTVCDNCPKENDIDECFRVKLPGVVNACCGHGKEGYIQFMNGIIIRGIFTEIFHKDDPHAYIEKDGQVYVAYEDTNK